MTRGGHATPWLLVKKILPLSSGQPLDAPTLFKFYSQPVDGAGLTYHMLCSNFLRAQYRVEVGFYLCFSHSRMIQPKR